MSAAQFVVAVFCAVAFGVSLLAERDFQKWLESLNEEENDDVR